MKIDPGPAPASVPGFRFAGVHGGIKKGRRRDVALIVADEAVPAAAVFTKNRAPAAPVVVAREHVRDGRLRAVLVNSGNANAATGARGLATARWSCTEVARRLGAAPADVLPCSTGVIGVVLDRKPLGRGIADAVAALSEKGFANAARATMTSDAFPKWAAESVELPGRDGTQTATVACMAKGAGMIEPDMATLLVTVLTDAPLGPGAAGRMLREGVAGSFNAITVDGDTSTNDTVVLMASGRCAVRKIRSRSSPGYAEVRDAVGRVLSRTARMCVADGEGATHVVDIVVRGATSDALAARGARAIARSTLMKCALAGADPNWGRVVMALGDAGIAVELERLSIKVAGVSVVRRGKLPSPATLARAARAMRETEYAIDVEIGNGRGRAAVVTSDLTEAYVHFNSAYTS